MLEPSLSTRTTKQMWLLHSEVSSSLDLEKISVRHIDRFRKYTINLGLFIQYSNFLGIEDLSLGRNFGNDIYLSLNSSNYWNQFVVWTTRFKWNTLCLLWNKYMKYIPRLEGWEFFFIVFSYKFPLNRISILRKRNEIEFGVAHINKNNKIKQRTWR